MRFDTTELSVAPGQTVEIVFVNPDGMQHNFVLGAQGSLDAIGAAADVVARAPNGLAQQYVPDSQAVLFSTKLLEPGQTMTFQFKAPGEPGKYPYVCTIPAHWKTRNGTLNVVAPAGRGRGRQSPVGSRQSVVASRTVASRTVGSRQSLVKASCRC